MKYKTDYKFDKTKNFYFSADEFFTSYYKANGFSFEVGIYFADKQIFFGNFINKTEAMNWYKFMNEKMTFFTEKYQYHPKMKQAWYFTFAKNYFYNMYYSYLKTEFAKYNTDYKKSFATYSKEYKKYSFQNFNY